MADIKRVNNLIDQLDTYLSELGERGEKKVRLIRKGGNYTTIQIDSVWQQIKLWLNPWVKISGTEKAIAKEIKKGVEELTAKAAEYRALIGDRTPVILSDGLKLVNLIPGLSEEMKRLNGLLGRWGSFMAGRSSAVAWMGNKAADLMGAAAERVRYVKDTDRILKQRLNTRINRLQEKMGRGDSPTQLFVMASELVAYRAALKHREPFADLKKAVEAYEARIEDLVQAVKAGNIRGARELIKLYNELQDYIEIAIGANKNLNPEIAQKGMLLKTLLADGIVQVSKILDQKVSAIRVEKDGAGKKVSELAEAVASAQEAMESKKQVFDAAAREFALAMESAEQVLGDRSGIREMHYEVSRPNSGKQAIAEQLRGLTDGTNRELLLNDRVPPFIGEIESAFDWEKLLEVRKRAYEKAAQNVGLLKTKDEEQEALVAYARASYKKFEEDISRRMKKLGMKEGVSFNAQSDQVEEFLYVMKMMNVRDHVRKHLDDYTRLEGAEKKYKRTERFLLEVKALKERVVPLREKKAAFDLCKKEFEAASKECDKTVVAHEIALGEYEGLEEDLNKLTRYAAGYGKVVDQLNR